MRCDGFTSGDDVGDIWFTVFIQGCWNADDHGTAGTDFGKIRAGQKPTGRYLGRNGFRRDMMDEAFTPIELLDLGLVDVQPYDMAPFSTKLQALGEPNISETYNGN